MQKVHRVAHTGCETGCFLLFAGVHSVLKLPRFVRFLSSFPAKYRRRCYMGCYIFSNRSGLPRALFRRINHPAVHAPRPISTRHCRKCVRLDRYVSFATLRLQSSTVGFDRPAKRWFVRIPAFYSKLTRMCFVRLDTLWDSMAYSLFENGSPVR
jgi:hypothetical protein